MSVQSIANLTPEELRQLAFMASRYITTVEEQRLVERCWKLADAAAKGGS